ncbi:hypothetical protein ACFVJS_00565 [Nocardioides sp. NPDC057772]|uniref:hypothetical protein n=1 Tax=Nocardioides sp. NPDC057772 TaxID=3346245 RepID=UPI003672F2BB
MEDINTNEALTICRRVSSLLVGLADHADEAGLGDLAVYLMTARAELVLGPWRAPWAEQVPIKGLSLSRGIAMVLDLLDGLREETEDMDGIVAIAMARLWVVDGVRWLDGAARKIAEAYRDSVVEQWRK